MRRQAKVARRVGIRKWRAKRAAFGLIVSHWTQWFPALAHPMYALVGTLEYWGTYEIVEEDSTTRDPVFRP